MSPKRVLAVDVGTHSTLYLVADVSSDGVIVVERGIYANHLGETAGDQGQIPQEVLNTNEKILRIIVHKGEEWKVERALGVGTAALRRASNQDQFLLIAETVGLPFRIISSQEEIRLSWMGVLGATGPSEFKAVLDIGGGSTELMAGEGKEPRWAESLPLGSVLLSRKFFRNDPPLEEEIEAGEQFVRETVQHWSQLLSLTGAPSHPSSPWLIGTAGTVTALAMVENRILAYSPDCITGLLLTQEAITRWADQLLKMNYSQRLNVPAMPVVRARYIPAGALILKVIVDILGLEAIQVSDRGVLFGVAMLAATD
ncbi:MAG: hypothetical protein ACK4OO_02010 [bacterium]